MARAKESGRTDDNEIVIKHRLDLYHRHAEPVVTYYSERGMLLQLDGTGTVNEVTERTLDAIMAGSRAELFPLPEFKKSLTGLGAGDLGPTEFQPGEDFWCSTVGSGSVGAYAGCARRHRTDP